MSDTESVKLSLTNDMRSFLLDQQLQRTYDSPKQNEDEDLLLKSVHGIAAEAGLTLEHWVWANPETAVITAQIIVANWENVLTNGLLGVVNGIKLTRESVALIERALINARKDLVDVQVLCGQGSPEQLRKDRLIEALYQKALRGDTKSIQYFMDRVEGRIPEAKDSVLDYDNAYQVYQILHTLFDKQLDVLNSGYGTRIVCTGRRAGKTRLTAAILLIEALRTTNTTCIYISKTMKMGEEGLLGPALNEIVEKCELKDSKGNKLNWKRLENGSKILVRGLSNTKDPDVIRGHKAKVIVIDEFFHLDSDLLDYLMNEVLKPMQLDYAAEYKQVLIGTPPRIRGTYGEKMWHELQVPHFQWTAQDNPYIKNFETFIDEECRDKGVDRGHPYIRREYYGEWAYDEDALLYPDFNTWSDDCVPRLNIDKILFGLDYGTSDNDAVIGIAWDSGQRRGFQFFESKFNRLTCPQKMTQLEFLKRECKEAWELALDFWPSLDKKDANNRITWEADSSDGHLTEELQYNLKCRYSELSMNIGVAHKHDKILMQDKIRDLLRSAGLLLMAGGKAVKECEMTVLKRDNNGNLLLDIDDKVYHPDLLPAMRYALWPAIGLEVIRARTGQDEANEHVVGDIEGMR